MAVIHFDERPLNLIASFDDGSVRRAGLLFRCGAYPEKGNFSLTEAEADAQISAFQAQPLDVEHRPSIFDGLLGSLERVWRVGSDIFGAVRVAPWVDSAWAAHGHKVSAAFDRETKKILGPGLVLAPHITDAALSVAFSDTHKEPTMTLVEQLEALLVSARQAETPSPTTTSQPAPPPTSPTPPPAAAAAPAAFGMVPASISMPSMGIHATPCGPANYAAAPAAAAAPANQPVDFAASLAARDARIAALEAQNRAELARTAVSARVLQGRVPPHQQVVFSNALAIALQDDAADKVTFALEATPTGGTAKVGARADALLAIMDSLPQSQMGQSMIPAAVFSAPADGQPTAEQKLIQESEASTKEYVARMNGHQANGSK